MSKAIVFSQARSDACIEILGVKASSMTQEEILCRASGVIHAPPTKDEKEFIALHSALPLPVPVVASGGTRSGKNKPKTVVQQLNDNHLGTTNFRSPCTTCGQSSESCCGGKSAAHVLPEPICPSYHAPTIVAICKATCFACSRLLSEEYEVALPPIEVMDYSDCANEVHKHGKSVGGKLATDNAAVANARWSKFITTSASINKGLIKKAADKGLYAIECERCGILQPSDISLNQKSLTISWNLSCAPKESYSMDLEHTWKPGATFWNKIFKVLYKTAMSEDGGYCPCVEDGSAMTTGPSSTNALQWICTRIIAIMRKQITAMSKSEVWLMRAFPFIIGGERLKSILENPCIASFILIWMSNIRDVDLLRMGKSPVYSHPRDLIWTNLYIPDKSLRPVVQESSGGMIRANDPRTDSYDAIIKRSAKLRAAVIQSSPAELEAWRAFCKFSSMPEFLATCFPDPSDVYHGHMYSGDVRTACPAVESVPQLYSSLYYEISAVFDHSVEQAMSPKNYNSGATGVKNAKSQAKFGRQKSVFLPPSSVVDGEELVTDIPMDVNAKTAKKRKTRASVSIDDNLDSETNVHSILRCNISSDLPCPCVASIFFGNANIDDESSSHLHYNWEDGAFGWTVELQHRAWLAVIAFVLSKWDAVHVLEGEYYISNLNDLTLSLPVFATWNTQHLLKPSTEQQLQSLITNLHSEDQSSSSCSSSTRPCDKTLMDKLQKLVDLHILLRNMPEQDYKPRITNPKLPSPEQHKTNKYKANSVGKTGSSPVGISLKHQLDGKTNLFRYNVLTKRVNFSGRHVLEPDGSLAPDEVGVPFRFCLSQTHPTIVTVHNKRDLEIRIAKARAWSYHGWLPDLGGVDSVFTDEGVQNVINSPLTGPTELFDDEVFVLQNQLKKRYIEETFKSESDLLEAWGAPLQIGWTCNLFLNDGDLVILSRPPALHRYNHNAHKIRAIPGYVVCLQTSAMEGYGADADGDAMMLNVLQSVASRCSISLLMPLAGNMMCPRRHTVICGLKQDALLGACLLIMESKIFKLSKQQATLLAPCLKLISRSRYNRVGFKGRGLQWVDPKSRFGTLWRLTIPEAERALDSSCARLPRPAGRDAKTGNPYWTGLQFMEATFPQDFCYYKRLDDCRWSITKIQSFISEYASLPEETTVREKFITDLQSPLLHDDERLSDALVFIWRGKWVCGRPSAETLSTSSGSIIEMLWRHYGKHYACDWMGDVCFIAQTYLSKIRCFSASIQDMIIGGRSIYSAASQIQSDGLTTESSISKVSQLRQIEHIRHASVSALESAFSDANCYMDRNSASLTYSDVIIANAKLADYANVMIMHTGDMFAAYNRFLKNNITMMSKTGSKGNSTNTAMMSSMLGVAKIKSKRSVGHDVTPTTRTFIDENYGERSSTSLGFIGRGFIHGLTGKQFFQTSREARNRIKNCSDPSVSGYLQTKVGVNSQSVSVRSDRTVRNQQHEIIQLNYGGNGYDPTKVKRVQLEAGMFSLAFQYANDMSESFSSSTLFQFNSILSLVLGKMAQRPSNRFAAADTLLKSGFSVLLNVDVPSLFLLHSGQWNDATDNCVTEISLCLKYDAFCARILQYDARQTLLPVELFLAVRLYMMSYVFPSIKRCTESGLDLLLDDIYQTYTENMVDIGEAVGGVACQSTSQPMTQIVMKSFKSDVTNTKEAQHLGTDISRINELLAFTDAKSSLTTITLSPEWVWTEDMALLVASQFVGVRLAEWTEENSHQTLWLNLAEFSRNTANSATVAATILECYSRQKLPKGSKLPQCHEVCVWSIKEDFTSLPGVHEYIRQLLAIEPLTDQEIIEEATKFIDDTWRSCMTSYQVGGLIVDESGTGPSASNPSGLTLSIWMAFIHTPRDIQSGLCDIDSNEQNFPLLANWLEMVRNMVSDMAYSLYVLGTSAVQALLDVIEPSEKYTGTNLVESGLPDISQCYRLRFRCKSLAPFLQHETVVDQLCYTSNVKEVKDIFGIEAFSHTTPYEASTILTSQAEDVYVQPVHLQLLTDIMTSGGDVFPMNIHGLKRKEKTSWIARMSFEDVTSQLLKAGVNANYDSFEHIVPNIMFSQRDDFIGSGACRVLYKEHDCTLPPSQPSDFERIATGPSPCSFFNLIDFIVGSNFQMPPLQ